MRVPEQRGADGDIELTPPFGIARDGDTWSVNDRDGAGWSVVVGIESETAARNIADALNFAALMAARRRAG